MSRRASCRPAALCFTSSANCSNASAALEACTLVIEPGRERRGVERRDRGVHAQRRRGGRCDHFRRTGAAAGPLCMSIHSAIILHIVPIEDDNVHLSDAE